MANSTETSRIPSLEPLWTTKYQSFGIMPKKAFQPVKNPQGLSPSPMPPKTPPSPMYARSYSYDSSMRKQEQGMLNSLDQQTRYPSVTGQKPLSLVGEDLPVSARLEKISLLPPISIQHGSPSPLPSPRERREHKQRSRSIVLHDGIPHPDEKRTYRSIVERSSLARSTLAVSKPSLAELREQLQKWGHVYYGNHNLADAFVIARPLRRHSIQPDQPSRDIKQDADSSSTGKMSDRLTVQAIIRPRALERKPFLIQRTFDVEELRATISDPTSSSEKSIERRPTPETPHIVPIPIPAHSGRRTSSIKTGDLFSGRQSKSSITMDPESPMPDPKAVPIHLKYARAHLPVLAALLASGHVREGDVIYFPLPHAEAWSQTVKYVYTGQGELTAAIRENIMYLAGKI